MIEEKWISVHIANRIRNIIYSISINPMMPDLTKYSYLFHTWMNSDNRHFMHSMDYLYNKSDLKKIVGSKINIDMLFGYSIFRGIGSYNITYALEEGYDYFYRNKHNELSDANVYVNNNVRAQVRWSKKDTVKEAHAYLFIHMMFNEVEDTYACMQHQKNLLNIFMDFESKKIRKNNSIVHKMKDRIITNNTVVTLCLQPLHDAILTVDPNIICNFIYAHEKEILKEFEKTMNLPLPTLNCKIKDAKALYALEYDPDNFFLVIDTLTYIIAKKIEEDKSFVPMPYLSEEFKELLVILLDYMSKHT